MRRQPLIRLHLALHTTILLNCAYKSTAAATPVCAIAIVSSPTDDNGCNCGACKSLTTSTMTCQYDSSFCDSGTEEWMTAAEVIDAGGECTCMDILNYPMNIGTCSSSGVYSPMAVASHCSGGTAVCDADTDGHYFLGDTANAVASVSRSATSMANARKAITRAPPLKFHIYGIGEGW